MKAVKAPFELLYDTPITVKNGVRLDPYPLKECDCVQYCRRLPRDLSGSVHYEVCPAKWEQCGGEWKVAGYWVVLHTESQTAEGNKEIRRNLVSFLKDGLRSKGAIWNSRFVLGGSWMQIDLHSKELIPSDLPPKKFVEAVTDLLGELYDLVEDLLVKAEHDEDLNPWGYDDEELQKVQDAEPILAEPMEAVPTCDEALWRPGTSATLINITRLVKMKLRIPNYQRPYKWTRDNVLELLKDIEDAIQQSDMPDGAKHYRLGTVILHRDAERNDGFYNVVDGQQRITTLALLRFYLTQENCGPILEDPNTLEHFNRSTISRGNLYENYQVIKNFFAQTGELKERFFHAMDNLLEVVLIRVREESEAFQLFDSQNTRGRALDPHDLLKAHHLRAMVNDGATERQMRRRVVGWESVNPGLIGKLFNSYLFRIYNWSRRERTHWFSSRDISVFKGLSRHSNYSFVRRTIAAGQEFQVGADFPAGDGFFAYVDHYLDLLDDVGDLQTVVKGCNAQNRQVMKRVMGVLNYPCTTWGPRYVNELFQCAIFCFCDRFGVENLDARAIVVLCKWAYALVLDLNRISEGSINRYAVGLDGYSNSLAMFALIKEARSPLEIVSLDIKVNEEPNANVPGLRERLKKLGGER